MIPPGPGDDHEPGTRSIDWSRDGPGGEGAGADQADPRFFRRSIALSSFLVRLVFMSLERARPPRETAAALGTLASAAGDTARSLAWVSTIERAILLALIGLIILGTSEIVRLERAHGIGRRR